MSLTSKQRAFLKSEAHTHLNLLYKSGKTVLTTISKLAFATPLMPVN